MIIKRDFTPNLLLLLFVVYFSQGSLYAEGSLLSQGSLFIIFVISLFYLFKTLILKNNKNTFYKVWTCLFCLNILGFILTASVYNSYQFGMFKGVMISSIPFFPFYYFAQQGILKSKNLKRFFFLILPVTILQYYLNANRILLTMTSGDADIVNNISYGFVSLIPFVFLFKQKRIISIVCMTILLFYIIQGAKRGALIAGGIGLLGFIYFQFQTIDKKNKFKGYLLVTVAIICVLYFVYNSYESNDFLISRMQKIGTEAGWSGRNRIYTTIVDKWSNSNSYLNLIFGFGFAASLKLTAGYFAHNDWLELLSNFGLLGIFVYSYIFYIAIRMVRSEGWNKDKRMMMLTIILMWFFITLVSMSYTSNIGFVQIILIAYLVGSKSKTVAT